MRARDGDDVLRVFRSFGSDTPGTAAVRDPRRVVTLFQRRRWMCIIRNGTCTLFRRRRREVGFPND